MGGVSKFFPDLIAGFSDLWGLAGLLHPALVIVWKALIFGALLALVPTAITISNPKTWEKATFQKLVNHWRDEKYADEYYDEAGKEALLARARDMPSGLPGAVYDKVFISGNSASALRILVLHERAFWQESRPDALIDESGQPVAVESLFTPDLFRAALGDYPDLVGLGLASRASSGREKENEALARTRAQQLCERASASLGNVSHRYWTLVIGHALPDLTGETFRHRPLVVIGVRAAPDFDLTKRLPMLATRSRVDGTDFGRYSLSASPEIAQCGQR